LPSSANHISTSAVNNWNMYGTGVASEHRAFRPPQQEETETVCNQWRGAGKTRCPIPATGESGDFVWLKRNSGTPRGVSRAHLKHGLSEKTLRGNKREEGYMNAGTANVSIPLRRRRRKWGKSEGGFACFSCSIKDVSVSSEQRRAGRICTGQHTTPPRGRWVHGPGVRNRTSERYQENTRKQRQLGERHAGRKVVGMRRAVSNGRALQW